MGGGAAKGVTTAVEVASKEDLVIVLKDLKDADRDKLAGALAKEEKVSEDKPIFYYLPIAARGDVTRLVGIYGGLEFEDKITPMGGGDLEMKSFGSPGGLPVMKHGDVKLSQSHAILSYFLSIAPKYKALAPAHKAKDLQFNLILDDLISSSVPSFFQKDPEMKTKIGEAITKWLTVLEEITPEKGFVNGLSYPTGADFVCLVLTKGYTPFLGLYKIAEMEPFEKYTKIKGVADRTLELPEIKAFVESEKCCLKNNPLGFP